MYPSCKGKLTMFITTSMPQSIFYSMIYANGIHYFTANKSEHCETLATLAMNLHPDNIEIHYLQPGDIMGDYSDFNEPVLKYVVMGWGVFGVVAFVIGFIVGLCF